MLNSFQYIDPYRNYEQIIIQKQFKNDKNMDF